MSLGVRCLVVAVALSFVAACGSDCPAGQRKGADGTCQLDLCAGVDCSKTPGTGCDPVSGACKDLCNGVAVKPSCTAPSVCDPTTGACVDKCAGKSCSAGEVCKASTGACVSKCAEANCDKTTQFCNESTAYECVSYCESKRKPTNKDECASGLKCDPGSGECVGLCVGTQCDYGEYCNPANGLCKGGPVPAGFPGSACTKDDDCHVDGLPEEQEFACLTEAILGAAPGGYCTASCSVNVPCPAGSFCLGGACYDQCTADSDCRNAPEYRCLPLSFLASGESSVGEFLCLPSPQCLQSGGGCSPAGGDCVDDTDCVSGAFCISESRNGQFSGFDGGYCLYPMHSGDACPTGSTAVPISEQDPDYVVCMKSCDLKGAFRNYTISASSPTQCGMGESCLSITRGFSPHGVCWSESCDVDEQCQVALCGGKSGDTSNCGTNQPCLKDDGTEVTGQEVGTCRTPDKCTKDSDCAKLTDTLGTTCDTVKGECFAAYCEPSIGSCLLDCTLFDTLGETDGACAGKTCGTGEVCVKGSCVSGICPTGTTCNATSRRCDRVCTEDGDCGANAVCDGGFCIARCSVHNEALVCGDALVCGMDGHCRSKCTQNSDCAGNQLCEATSGRCVYRCDAMAHPTTCDSTERCDSTSGLCVDRCTYKNELTLCGSTKFCQTSTGICLASCSGDETVCGAEACSVDPTDATIGYCGFECTSDGNCGSTPGGRKLTCQAVTGSSIKRCQ